MATKADHFVERKIIQFTTIKESAITILGTALQLNRHRILIFKFNFPNAPIPGDVFGIKP